MKPHELEDLIVSRRSVFPQNYSHEKVEDSIVRKMLESANWAPTHKLTEPWRFVVFTGEGLKRLAVLQADVYKKVTQANGSFKEERFQNLLIKPMQSSHIIVVGMKRSEAKLLPEVEELGAVFCAIQNMHLTATAYGIGAYLSTGGITYFEESKEIFGLQKEDRLIGFFNVGMLKQAPSSGMRRPVEEKVTWYDH